MRERLENIARDPRDGCARFAGSVEDTVEYLRGRGKAFWDQIVL